VKTIVTTNMADVLTEDYNVKLIEVLTGFKYIGEQIKWFEEDNSYSYVFGLEESYGCLAGTYARDKDACVAVMMLCEVAASYKAQGKTLWDGMLEIYEKYGYFREGLETITMKGITGAEQIQAIMEKLRNNPPTVIGGVKVKEFRDYKSSVAKNLATGEESQITLPKSNVLYFDMEDNYWCCARPSGTEPKIKFYIGVKGTSLEDSDARLKKTVEDLMRIVEG
jgi:phosphoglucomutase